MGVHGQTSNKKRAKGQRSAYRICRDKLSRKAKKRIVGEIPDADIAPDAVFKERQKNSRTNVELSGKKKRKIMKQLKRLNSNKPKDVEMDEVPSTSNKKKQRKVKDVAMDDGQTESVEEKVEEKVEAGEDSDVAME